MKVEEFKLERWLLKPCEIDAGGGGVTKLKLRDIVTNIDYDQLLNYGPTNGSERLRRLIAEWYPGVKAENVLVTTATSEANLLCNLHLLEPGDEYLAIYPLYEQTTGFAKILGCPVKKIYLSMDKKWKLDFKLLRKSVTRKTKIIFFDNPNNPTGACFNEKEMKAICQLAEEVGAYVICDNALRGSELDGKPAATPFKYSDRGIITGSLSKLGMTGPRIGWIIANKDIVNACWKFKDYTTLSHPGIGEYLATIAMQKENRLRYIQRNLEISKKNLSMLSDWIDENCEMVNWVAPKAGFTGFLKYADRISFTSEEFCIRFLKEENVLLSPGEYFGMDRYFRINFGCKNEMMPEILKRLKNYMKRLLSTFR